MAVKANELVNYMETHLFALSSDVGWIGEAEVARAINDGRVRHASISVYRQDGEVYWLRSVSVEQILDGLARRALPYCGSTKEPPLAGSVKTLQVEHEFDKTSATAALVYARERGWVNEYQVSGGSHFVVPEMENDPRVKKFFSL